MYRSGLVPLAACALLAGCQSTSESAGSNELAANVGVYSPPPPGAARPRLGIPPVAVGSSAARGMDELAADQLSTLMVRADRFDVIERSQLGALLDEQDLEGIVAAGELAQPAEVRGVEYLLLAKVTNLRSKATRTGSNSGLGKLLSISNGKVTGGVGAGVEIDNEKVEMKVECGVDLRLVDPSTGAVFEAAFSEYTRTDKASAFGVQVLGIGADADAEIDMSADDRGLIMRLAFDDAIRGMLPGLDRKLRALGSERSAPAAAAAAAAPPGDASDSAAAGFCGKCGTERAPDAAFCVSCGAKHGG